MKNIKGDISEKLATVYFQKQGFKVFEQSQTNTPFDLIVFDPNTWTHKYVEVRTENRAKSKKYKGKRISRIPRIKNKGIFMVYVNIETGGIHEVQPRCKIHEKI